MIHTAFFVTVWILLNGLLDSVPVFCAMAFHELGHILVCRLFGAPIRSLRPLAAGAAIGYDATSLSYLQEIAVAAAGPLINLLSCFLVWGCRGRFAALFGAASLSLALFNLLPHKRLDGGVILSAMLSLRGSAALAARCVNIFSRLLTVLLWMCAVAVQLRCGGNLSILFVSVYLLMTL